MSKNFSQKNALNAFTVNSFIFQFDPKMANLSFTAEFSHFLGTKHFFLKKKFSTQIFISMLFQELLPILDRSRLIVFTFFSTFQKK